MVDGEAVANEVGDVVAHDRVDDLGGDAKFGEALAAGLKVGEAGTEPGLVVEGGAGGLGRMEGAVELEGGVAIELPAVEPGLPLGRATALMAEAAKVALGAGGEVVGDLEVELVELVFVLGLFRGFGVGEIVAAGLWVGSVMAPPFDGFEVRGGEGERWERGNEIEE